MVVITSVGRPREPQQKERQNTRYCRRDTKKARCPVAPARATRAPLQTLGRRRRLLSPPRHAAAGAGHRQLGRPAGKAAVWPSSSPRWWAGAGAAARARRRGSPARAVLRGGGRCSLRIRRGHGRIWGLHGGGSSFGWGWRPEPGGGDSGSGWGGWRRRGERGAAAAAGSGFGGGGWPELRARRDRPRGAGFDGGSSAARRLAAGGGAWWSSGAGGPIRRRQGHLGPLRVFPWKE